MQNNTDKEFSELLRNKLEDTSLDFNEELWDKTFSKYRQERLGQRRKRALAWIGSVTGVILIAGYFAFFSGPFGTEENYHGKRECSAVVMPELKTDKFSNKDKHDNTGDLSASVTDNNKFSNTDVVGEDSKPEKHIATPRVKSKAREADKSPVEIITPSGLTNLEIEVSPKLDNVSGGNRVLSAGAIRIPSKKHLTAYKPGKIVLREIKTSLADAEADEAVKREPSTGEISGNKDQGAISGDPKKADQPVVKEEAKKADTEKTTELAKEPGKVNETEKPADKSVAPARIRVKNDSNIWARIKLSKNSPYYHAWQVGASFEMSESYRSLTERGNGLDTGYIRLRNRAERVTRTHAVTLNVQYNFNRFISIGSGVAFVQSGYKGVSGKYLIYEVDTLGNPKEKLQNYSARTSYNFVSVPFTLQLSPIVHKAFSVSAFAGINAMFIINDQGIVPSMKDRKPIVLENDKDQVKYNQVHLTASYGFTISSYLGKHLQVSVAPSWRKSLNSLYAPSMPIDERIKSKGLTFGLSYGF